MSYSRDMTQTQNTQQQAPSIRKFRDLVTSLGGMFYRIDNHLTNGRNGHSTDATMRARYVAARDLLSAACQSGSDPLPEYLDTHDKLAEKWAVLERRMVGLDR